MISSARPSIPLVVITIFTRKMYCFGRFWKVGMDGQHVWQLWSLPAVIRVGRVDQKYIFGKLILRLISNMVKFIGLIFFLLFLTHQASQSNRWSFVSHMVSVPPSIRTFLHPSVVRMLKTMLTTLHGAWWVTKFVRLSSSYFLRPVEYEHLGPEGINNNRRWPCGTITLFLPLLLPNKQRIIYSDTDILFLDAPSKLWSYFSHMQESHIMALAQDYKDSLFGLLNHKTENLNGGLILMDLGNNSWIDFAYYRIWPNLNFNANLFSNSILASYAFK